MNQQATALGAHRRQNRSIDPHYAKDVDLEGVFELFWSECFGHPQSSDAGVVDHHVESAGALQRLLNGALNGAVVRDVEVEHFEGQFFAGGERFERHPVLGIARLDIAHRGEDAVPAAGKSLGSLASKTSAGPVIKTVLDIQPPRRLIAGADYIRRHWPGEEHRGRAAHEPGTPPLPPPPPPPLDPPLTAVPSTPPPYPAG